jgi:hypothetical protein
MTVEVETATAPAAHPKRSYFIRHWRGELSLPQSYWVNGVLLWAPFNIYLRVASLITSERPLDYLEWQLLPYILWIPIATWQYVGIWRSAGNRIRSGKFGWSWVARLIVIAGVIIVARSAIITATSAYSMWIAYGKEQSAVYDVSQTADRVNFSGEITPDSADKLDAFLNKKGIDRLVIRQSIGGFVLPALRLAETIHQKQLTVVVTGQCASMCAVLLAAGAKRFVLPESVIQLHTASDVGTGEAIEDSSKDGGDAVKQAEGWFKRAGVGDELLAKIRAHHGPLDLYEPTINELITNGLVTDVYDAPLSGYLPARQWCNENPQPCARTGRQNLTAKPQGH